MGRKKKKLEIKLKKLEENNQIIKGLEKKKNLEFGKKNYRKKIKNLNLKKMN